MNDCYCKSCSTAKRLNYATIKNFNYWILTTKLSLKKNDSGCINDRRLIENNSSDRLKCTTINWSLFVLSTSVRLLNRKTNTDQLRAMYHHIRGSTFHFKLTPLPSIEDFWCVAISGWKIYLLLWAKANVFTFSLCTDEYRVDCLFHYTKSIENFQLFNETLWSGYRFLVTHKLSILGLWVLSHIC